MKRKFNIFWLLYTYIIFWPIGAAYTVFTALMTILMVNVGVPARAVNSFVAFWARLLCWLALSPVTVEGAEHLDPRGSYLFLSNHQGIFEIFAIYGYIPNRFSWIMKQEIRSIPFVGKACEKVGHIFIDRSSKMKAMHSLEQAEQRLRTMHSSVVMFPEGTRTHDGQVGRFKRGAFFMARDLHLPIVPLTVSGSYQIMPRDSYYIQPHRLRLVFHQPVDTEGLTDDNMPQYIDQVRNTIIQDL